MKDFMKKFIKTFWLFLVGAGLPAFAVGTFCAWLGDCWRVMPYAVIISIFCIAWISGLFVIIGPESWDKPGKRAKKIR